MSTIPTTGQIVNQTMRPEVVDASAVSNLQCYSLTSFGHKLPCMSHEVSLDHLSKGLWRTYCTQVIAKELRWNDAKESYVVFKGIKNQVGHGGVKRKLVRPAASDERSISDWFLGSSGRLISIHPNVYLTSKNSSVTLQPNHFCLI